MYPKTTSDFTKFDDRQLLTDPIHRAVAAPRVGRQCKALVGPDTVRRNLPGETRIPYRWWVSLCEYNMCMNYE